MTLAGLCVVCGLVWFPMSASHTGVIFNEIGNNKGPLGGLGDEDAMGWSWWEG